MPRKSNLVSLFLVFVFLSTGCATTKGPGPSAKPKEEIEDKAPVINDEVIESSVIANVDPLPEAAAAAVPTAVGEWDSAAKVCLVLGPGMARGFAHAGVLEAVAESKLKIHCIVGTEMGALVGAIYALNESTNTLQWQLFKLRKETYLDFPLFSINDRIASGAKLHRFLQDNFGNKRTSDLKVPFTISATEAGSGNPILLRDEVLADALAVSLSLPGVFKARELGVKGFLLSGSGSSPLPVKEAFDLGATHVIAVDLLSDAFTMPTSGGAALEIAKQFAAARNLSRLQRSETPYFIAPDLRAYSFTDFDKRVEIVSVAKRAAQEALVQIQAQMRTPVEEKK